MARDEPHLGEPSVSPLTPEARPVALAAAAVYIRHTRPWLIGILAHGSALKGDCIPGCSDVDLHLYLRDAAFDSDGALPLDLGLAIQRDLASIPLGPFGYIQGYALPPGTRPGWVGPVPGAYHMVLGRLPRPEATGDDLRAAARRALEGLRPTPAYIAEGMLTYSLPRLERHARLLATDVWPFVYHILTLIGPDPIAVWGLPRTRAIAALPSDMREAAVRFHHAARAGFAAPGSVDGLLAVIRQGVAFRAAASAWYRALAPE